MSGAHTCSEFCEVVPDLKWDAFILGKAFVDRAQSAVRRGDTAQETLKRVPLPVSFKGAPGLADGSRSWSVRPAPLEPACLSDMLREKLCCRGDSSQCWLTFPRMVPRGPPPCSLSRSPLSSHVGRTCDLLTHGTWRR